MRRLPGNLIELVSKLGDALRGNDTTTTLVRVPIMAAKTAWHARRLYMSATDAQWLGGEPSVRECSKSQALGQQHAELFTINQLKQVVVFS